MINTGVFCLAYLTFQEVRSKALLIVNIFELLAVAAAYIYEFFYAEKRYAQYLDMYCSRKDAEPIASSDPEKAPDPKSQ
jgi:hypothetical protein